MRTTIDLPDDVLRDVKVRAAQSGVRLKELIRRYVEIGLRHDDEALQSRAGIRSPVPVARKATGHTIPLLSNAEIAEILDAEDAERIIEQTR